MRLTTGSTCNHLPAWSPDGNTIAFLSNQTSTPPAQDLWLIAPDGSRLREAAHSVPYARDTVFGDSLAWIGNTGDLMVHEANWQWEIMRFHLSQLSRLPVTRSRVDGSDRNFTQTAGMVVFATSNNEGIGKRSLCFSPDGSQLGISIARYESKAGIGADLYLLDLRTGKVTQLTRIGESVVWNLYPTWSSKDIIAFSSGPTRFGPCQLHLIRSDGSGLKRLTHNHYDNVHPAWSPDSKHLVFAAGTGSGRSLKVAYNLYVMQVA